MYTSVEALPTTCWAKLIDKREFAKAALDKNCETFVIYVLALEAMTIHLFQAAQIAALQWDKTFTKISAEYSDYADVFLSNLAIELLENTGMNKYAIKLIERKQLPYRPIYALSPVELEILKAYIETPLKTGFIWSFKSPSGAPIFFNKKFDGSVCLCVDYWGLNNLTIKNRYLFPLLGEALDCLGRAKRFTQLDLTSAYHQLRIWEADE